MFESSLYLNQRFFKEIESEEYSFVKRFNFRELYLQIHKYKFTLVKHCQLFDFQTGDFVFTNLACLVGLSLPLISFSFQKKKKKKELKNFINLLLASMASSKNT